MPEQPLFERLCIIGPGLVGSSILRLARERGDIARHLVASALQVLRGP